MLSKELREKLIELMKKVPKEAIKEIEKDPKILEILLNNDLRLENEKERYAKQLETEKREKIKYINMTYDMQVRLEEKARQLRTTQGLLIGAGILLLLSLLDDN